MKDLQVRRGRSLDELPPDERAATLAELDENERQLEDDARREVGRAFGLNCAPTWQDVVDAMKPITIRCDASSDDLLQRIAAMQAGQRVERAIVIDAVEPLTLFGELERLRSLIARYALHVGAAEGSDFLRRWLCNRPFEAATMRAPGEYLSDAEHVEILKLIDKEQSK